MKHFFAILIFAAPLFLQGQEIKVNVVFKNEPLPYTYISVNQKPVAITDASGIARISVNNLNIGDTITSNMMGLLPVSLIYDRQIQQNQSCELIHTEEVVYDIEEITTTGYSNKTSRKIFRKVAKMYHQLVQSCFASGNFTSLITLSNRTPHPVNGTFVLENNLPKMASREELNRIYFNATPPLIETRSDTASLSRELQLIIRDAYVKVCGIIEHLYIEHRRQMPYSKLIYLGLREDHHFFNYTISDPRLIGVIQVVFEVDAESQELTDAKITTLSIYDDRYSNYTIDISCEKLSIPPKGKATVTVPKEIEANIIRPDGTTIDLKLYDTSIKFQ